MKQLIYLSAILSIALSSLACKKSSLPEEKTLKIYCAAGLREPMEELSNQYTHQRGIKFNITYGGSGELLAKIKFSKPDIYLPADSDYISIAENQGVKLYSSNFLKLTPIVMLSEALKSDENSLGEILQKHRKLIIGDRSSAIGRLSHKILLKYPKVKFTTMPTVNTVASQIAIGAGDIGIVWHLQQRQFPHHYFIKYDEFSEYQTEVHIAALREGENHQRAVAFLQYIKNNKSAQDLLKKYNP